MLPKVIIFTILNHFYLVFCSEVYVQTSLGKIRGIIQKSRKGNDYYSFRGIRYAEAPVGENRFRPAIPVKPWNSTMDATKDGFICPQEEVSHSLMSEDCLTLNVYSRSLNEELLPVMFYIHGGRFVIGGSHNDIFWNPQYLMDKNIVLVVINYRLGLLGFISTRSKEAPGNLGIKDQVLAMQWVRDNIRNFGGDPNQVTLWGHSAGSMMVTLHLVSPMSLGLFHRAIAMSGSAMSHVATPVLNTTNHVAKTLLCPTDNSKLLVECLRSKPWEKFIDIKSDVFDWFYEIEGNFGQEQFMSEHPSVLLSQGKIAKVPVIAGITKDEMEPFAYFQYYNAINIKQLNSDFSNTAPLILYYDPSLTLVTNVLRFAYFWNEPITKKNLLSYGKLLSDAYVGHSVHRFVNMARKYTDVFFYRQDFQGRYSWVYDPNGKPYGVCHADDILYLFVHTQKAPLFAETDPENVMVETSTALFTTFAQTGNPNNRTNPWTSDIKWKPSNKNYVVMLYINQRSFLGPYKNRMNLWDKLFQIPTK